MAKKQTAVEAPTTISAEDLADEVGRSGKVVRAFLRKNFTRPSESKGSRWMIEASVADEVRQHYAAIDEARTTKASA